MDRLAKFFIICAATFALGLVLFVVGLSTGGVDGFHKVANHNSWLSTGSQSVEVTSTKGEFNKITAEGSLDVVVVGESYYSEAVNDNDLMKEDIKPEPGMIVLRYGDEYVEPKVEFNGNELHINSKQKMKVGVSLDLGDDKFNVWPTAIIFCDDNELKSITVDSDFGDIDIKGVDFAKADLEGDMADLEVKDIKSKGLKIHSEDADVEISGDLRGKTEIDLDDGDVEISTKADYKDYTIEASVLDGVVAIGDNEAEYVSYDDEGYTYKQKGGEDSLLITLLDGEINIDSHDKDN
ncbi:MAG: DUF4097 family beta strand repeat protein [Firmicutes bacterium]|nr:DUF4097 family beta strand repeat protein [Bacillota bacterium]